MIEPSCSPGLRLYASSRKKRAHIGFASTTEELTLCRKRTLFRSPIYKMLSTTVEERSNLPHLTSVRLLAAGPYRTGKGTVSFLHTQRLVPVHKDAIWTGGRSFVILSSRLMSIVLRDLLYKVCLCYLDDIVIFARTPEELLERLRVVLNRLREVGLKPSKCALFQTQIHFLGHLISEHGVNPQPEKIKAIQEWPRPKCVKEVRAFYGLASYYRKFVKGFATIAEPLTKLTQKNVRFEWSDEAQTAFDTLKQALQDATSLAYPHPNIPCIVDSDASDVAIGTVLSQVIDGVERPIAFYSKVMNATQRNYCPTRRELLVVIPAMQHFRHYLLWNKVVLRTDHHSLKWLNTFKRPEGIMARWIETLAEFDYTIEHRPGRLHCNADGVSRPICKQYYGKTAKTPWVDELDRADELSAPLGMRALFWAPEHSAEDIVALQAEDEDIAPVMHWLQTDYVPDADELRSFSLITITRSLWSQRAKLEFREDVLVGVLPDRIQLVVPQAIRRALFDHTHSGALAAHLGTEKTFTQLKQCHFWPQMRKYIETWYRQCVDCARGRESPNRPMGNSKKSSSESHWTWSPSIYCRAFPQTRKTINTYSQSLTTFRNGLKHTLLRTLSLRLVCERCITIFSRGLVYRDSCTRIKERTSSRSYSTSFVE